MEKNHTRFNHRRPQKSPRPQPQVEVSLGDRFPLTIRKLGIEGRESATLNTRSALSLVPCQMKS